MVIVKSDEKLDGKNKSGRAWKVKQISRFSAITKCGVLSHLKKSLEQKSKIREDINNVKALEKRLKEETEQKRTVEKQRRAERKKIRMANEYKNSVYQVLKPETLKNMSKKQLRNVKKTSMNKNGQIELVNPYQ